MDLGPSARASEYLSTVTAFMDAHVYPAEPTYARRPSSHSQQAQDWSETAPPACGVFWQRTKKCGP